jgi:hypothetical protein
MIRDQTTPTTNSDLARNHQTGIPLYSLLLLCLPVSKSLSLLISQDDKH